MSINIPDRPAFMQLIDRQDSIKLNTDYILQIDDEHLFVNIIKSKKGGKNNMKTEIIRVAKPKMEEYLKEFQDRKSKLQERKTLAIEEAVKKVTEEIELEFIEEENTLDKLINDVSEEKEIEVEEEAVETEEVVTDIETTEENVIPEVTAEQPVNQVF